MAQYIICNYASQGKENIFNKFLVLYSSWISREPICIPTLPVKTYASQNQPSVFLLTRIVFMLHDVKAQPKKDFSNPSCAISTKTFHWNTHQQNSKLLRRKTSIPKKKKKKKSWINCRQQIPFQGVPKSVTNLMSTPTNGTHKAKLGKPNIAKATKNVRWSMPHNLWRKDPRYFGERIIQKATASHI